MNAELLWKRIILASRLDPHLYEEVEADRSSIGQATLIVILSSVAAGIGGMPRSGIGGLFVITLSALLSWLVWAWLTYLIGTKILPEPQTRAEPGELLRTIGFSSSPGLIRVLGIIPMLTVLVNLIAGIWMLVAMVVAVRQALDYQSTWRAAGVCIIGWVLQAAVLAFILLFYR